MKSFETYIAKKTTILSFKQLSTSFNWDKNEELGIWGYGGTTQIGNPYNSFNGNWYLGNLHFEGAIRIIDNSVELSADTKMIYP